MGGKLLCWLPSMKRNSLRLGDPTDVHSRPRSTMHTLDPSKVG